MSAIRDVTEVTCRFHGPMHYSFQRLQWECAGFDGEGCDRSPFRDEDLHAVIDAARFAGRLWLL